MCLEHATCELVPRRWYMLVAGWMRIGLSGPEILRAVSYDYTSKGTGKLVTHSGLVTHPETDSGKL